MNCLRLFGVMGNNWYVCNCGWVLILCAGCDGGPTRYSVGGVVQFNGNPVPSGRLVFTPDHPKGNQGPQGVADILQGNSPGTPPRRVLFFRPADRHLKSANNSRRSPPIRYTTKPAQRRMYARNVFIEAISIPQALPGPELPGHYKFLLPRSARVA